jgi:hypothetical protein
MAVSNIINGGLIAGDGQAHENDVCKKSLKKVGRGIYCTPAIETAEGYA